MAWPNSPTGRLRTYGPSDPVRSNDLNSIQDAIINKTHGDRVRIFSPASMVDGDGGAILYSGTPAACRLNSTTKLGLTFDQGDRIKSLTYARLGNGAADLQITLSVTTPAGVDSLVINAVADNNPAAAWADNTIDFADTLLDAGKFATLEFFPSVADVLFIGSIRVTYDRP